MTCWQGLYTHTLFEFGDPVLPALERGLELGRSSVRPRYQDRRSLDYLWWGIDAFLRRYPGYRYLFGPVSIPACYGREYIARLVYLNRRYCGGAGSAVRARRPHLIEPALQSALDEQYRHMGLEQGFRATRRKLSENGLAVPPLYKHYLEAAHPDGVHVAAFNVDTDFGDCVGGFVLVDLTRLRPQKQKRYLGREDYFDGRATTGGADPLQHAVDFGRASRQQPLQG